MKLIDKAAVVAEIERLIVHSKEAVQEFGREGYMDNVLFEQSKIRICEAILSFLDTLEAKESKLPNPRFPHLDKIVDKVFGAGNLESFEYEEAEQLVLLAKEELLKDLEAKEVDYGKVFNDEYSKFSNDTDAMDYAFPIDLADYKDFAKHFFELGLKTKTKNIWHDANKEEPEIGKGFATIDSYGVMCAEYHVFGADLHLSR